MTRKRSVSLGDAASPRGQSIQRPADKHTTSVQMLAVRPSRGPPSPGPPVNSHVVSLCPQMFITPMSSSWGGGGWGLVKCLTPALCRVRPLNHTSVVGDSAPCPRPHLNLNLFPATAAMTEPSGARIYFLAWQQTSGGLRVIILQNHMPSPGKNMLFSPELNLNKF